MNQTFMWGNVPCPEAVRCLERLSDFVLMQDLGPAAHKMVQAWFEPGGFVRELAGCGNPMWFKQLTGPNNELRRLIEHIQPALIKMEEKDYGKQVVEIREFLTRLGEWNPDQKQTATHPDIANFIRRGFPRLEQNQRPVRKKLPLQPAGPPPRPPGVYFPMTRSSGLHP